MLLVQPLVCRAIFNILALSCSHIHSFIHTTLRQALLLLVLFFDSNYIHSRPCNICKFLFLCVTIGHSKSAIGPSCLTSLRCLDPRQFLMWPTKGLHLFADNYPATARGPVCPDSLGRFIAITCFHYLLLQVHSKSTRHHKWLVVVDAAAYASTHPLDLSKYPADFVPLSFYKMFGYPTGESQGGLNMQGLVVASRDLSGRYT